MRPGISPGLGGCMVRGRPACSAGWGVSITASGAVHHSSPCTSQQSEHFGRFSGPRMVPCRVTFGALSALSLFWRPLSYVVPLFVFAAVASLVQAALSASQACFTTAPRSQVARLQLECLTAFLHLLQPFARLYGRLRYGLTPWRQGAPWLSLPRRQTSAVWSERWQDPIARIQCLETVMRQGGGVVVLGENMRVGIWRSKVGCWALRECSWLSKTTALERNLFGSAHGQGSRA